MESTKLYKRPLSSPTHSSHTHSFGPSPPPFTLFPFPHSLSFPSPIYTPSLPSLPQCLYALESSVCTGTDQYYLYALERTSIICMHWNGPVSSVCTGTDQYHLYALERYHLYALEWTSIICMYWNGSVSSACPGTDQYHLICMHWNGPVSSDLYALERTSII